MLTESNIKRNSRPFNAIGKQILFHVESIHPSFSFPAFFIIFFCFYRHYYCFVFTSGGPHQQEVSLFSSLFYSTKTGSSKMRDSMGLTNWIILRITAYNICSNNMYLFFKYDCTVHVCLEELALGNWVPPNPSLLF